MAPYNPLLPQTPQIPLVGISANPASLQNSDMTWSVPILGRHGEQLVSPVHDNHYVAASRGNYFSCGAVTTTGAAILAPGGTTSGVCFGVPATAGVLMEVHKIRVVPFGATVVVAALALEYGVTPVSTTYQTAQGMPIGNPGTPKCKVWDAVTIVANTYLRALPLWFDATTDISNNVLDYDFQGSLVISPGFAVNLVSTTSQGSIKFLVDVEWSEWLA